MKSGMAIGGGQACSSLGQSELELQADDLFIIMSV